MRQRLVFLSTLSLRRATNDSKRLTYQQDEFLSTLSLRRATKPMQANSLKLYISIHALLAESDNGYVRYCIHARVISIHALLAESDCVISVQIGGNVGFLSTLSLRRATAASITPTASRRNFYPRSPCGERPTLPGKAVTTRGFLSTLSLRRATAIHNAKINKHNNFYPRSPCGERQVSESIGTLRTVISIHALLAESDP